MPERLTPELERIIRDLARESDSGPYAHDVDALLDEIKALRAEAATLRRQNEDLRQERNLLSKKGARSLPVLTMEQIAATLAASAPSTPTDVASQTMTCTGPPSPNTGDQSSE